MGRWCATWRQSWRSARRCSQRWTLCRQTEAGQSCEGHCRQHGQCRTTLDLSDRPGATCYYEPRRLSYNDRIWRGRDGRYHCRRDNGTTGLIIGAAVGALVGRELDGGRDRTVGTIIGAAGGGLL